ncbi:unnamed protein product [Caenorhabditis angaria]|uniref:Uncharacterized protein n=1 Tax=Caenorhabditis angaria TaxID=860376 RepID=A0A9P1IQF4_9PELO|nr:unnamed protein product [Caenorhabditis angaria]
MSEALISGVLADGTPIISGSTGVEGHETLLTSTPAIHHVSSFNQFQAESWDGEHAEHEHEDPEGAARRFSIYLEQEAGSAHHNNDDEEATPIASSAQFEPRARSASLAAALLELDPRGVPLVQFFKLATHQPLLEIDEDDEEVEPGEAEHILARLLFTLKMVDADKHSSAVQRLRELEEELRQAGAVTPADPAVSDAVARALAVAGAGRDVQIRVNQSKHTTTTKTVYETETPGMASMDSDQIRALQQQILADISSQEHSDSGTTQKKETAEEGFTNEDGSVVVSKKMTRVVTTTRTTLPGESTDIVSGHEQSAPDSPVESLGSVKDRIAKFEAESASSSHLSTVGIVVTPHTPIPSDREEDEEDQHVESDDQTSKHAELKDTREFDQDEELAGELQPSEEHVAKAEIKDIKSYSPTSSEGAMSPSEHIHQVAETFEKHESELEHSIEPVYSGHDSIDEQTSPIVSEKPITQEYAESVTSELSSRLAESPVPSEKSVQPTVESFTTSSTTVVSESPIAAQRSTVILEQEHPVAAQRSESPAFETTTSTTVTREYYTEPESPVQPETSTEVPVPSHRSSIAESSPQIQQDPEESDDDNKFGDKLLGFAKKAGMVAGGVIAAPVALAAIGAKTAYDKLKRDSEDEEDQGETSSQFESTKRPSIQAEDPSFTTIGSDSPAPSERSVIKPSDSIESPVQGEESDIAAQSSGSPVPSESEHPHIIETVTTTTITREYESEPQSEITEGRFEQSESPVPSEKSSVQQSAGSPIPSEKSRPESPSHDDQSQIVETTTTTVVREYFDEPETTAQRESPVPSEKSSVDQSVGSPVPSESEHPHVIETTTTTTVTREIFDEPQQDSDSQSPVPSEKSSIQQRAESPVQSESEHPHVIETITTTTVTREYEDEPEHRFERSASPVPSEKSQSSVAARVESPVPSERSSVQQSAGSPIPSEKSRPESPIHEEEPHIVETTTTTTVVREYFEEPEQISDRQSPVPSEKSSIQQSAGFPVPSESEHPQVIETTTTTTVTREIFDEPEQAERDSPVPSEKSSIQQSAGSPIPSEKSRADSPSHEYEPHIVETTTTTTITREFFDEPESPVAEHQFERSASPVLSEKSHSSVAAHPESPIPSEKSRAESPIHDDQSHIVETTTTTTVVREYLDEPEQISESQSPVPSEKSSIQQSTGSPVPSESEHPHVTETTTTTTVTREYFDEPQSLTSAQQESTAPVGVEKLETTETSISQQQDYDNQSEPIISGVLADGTPIISGSTGGSLENLADEPRNIQEPLSQHREEFSQHQEYPAGEYHSEQPEEEESKFGDKLLGFAKKAGMVAGGVIAAPVALAAIGAKTAYGKLKRDSDDEEDQGEPSTQEATDPLLQSVYEKHDSPVQEEQKFISESPVPSEKSSIQQSAESPILSERSSIQHLPESPVPSESEHSQFVKTTTTTTITREHFDEEPIKADSPVEFEKSVIESSEYEEEPTRVIETTTTTTTTREYFDEHESPVPSESEHPHVIETITTTVTREYEVEPEHRFERSASPVPSEKSQSAVAARVESPVPSERSSVQQSAGSPIPSEKSRPESPIHDDQSHIIETTTTTTVVREYFEEPEQISERQSPVPSEKSGIQQSAESPIQSEKSRPESPSHDESHIVETTTTTTVVREYFEEPEQISERQSPVPSEKSGIQQSAESPIQSEKSRPESPSHDESHIVETTTTTTVVREYFEEPEQISERQSPVPSEKSGIQQSAESPIQSEKSRPESPSHDESHIVETTTTTTVVREYFEEPEQISERQSPVPSEKSSVHQSVGSPVPSESEHPHVTETTTTTTVTREFFDEPEQASDRQSPVPSERYSVQQSAGSPVPSEKSRAESPIHDDEPHIVETTTTTTVTREFFDEPESPVAEQRFERSVSPVLSEKSHSSVAAHPESPVPSEKSSIQQSLESPVPSEAEQAHVIETTTTTTREYFDEPEAERESPVPSDKSEAPVEDVVRTTTITQRFYEGEDEPVPVYRTFTVTQGQESDSEGEESGIKATTTTTVTRQLEDHGDDTSHIVELTETTTVYESVRDSRPSGEYRHESPTRSTLLGNLSGEEEDDEPSESSKLLGQTDPMSDREFAQVIKHSTSTDEPTVDPPAYESETTQEEPEGSKFGDKLLGFAKKAGMVAGGVIAAPVALAAIGAKTAYDKLKRDSEDEEEQGEPEASDPLLQSVYEKHDSPVQEEQKFISESPVPSEKSSVQQSAGSPDLSERSSIQHLPESPIQEQEERKFTSESPAPSEKSSVQQFSESPIPSERSSVQHLPESPIPSENVEILSQFDEEHPPHIIETTTTTTVTREFYEDSEENIDEPLAEQQPYDIETSTTTTVKTEVEEDEPDMETKTTIVKREFEDFEEETPEHVVETITTTTITRELDPSHDFPDSTQVEEEDPTTITTVHREIFDENEESSDNEEPEHVTVTTTSVVSESEDKKEPVEFNLQSTGKSQDVSEYQFEQDEEESQTYSELPENPEDIKSSLDTTELTQDQDYPTSDIKEQHREKSVPSSLQQSSEKLWEPESPVRSEFVASDDVPQSAENIHQEFQHQPETEKTETTTTTTHAHFDDQESPRSPRSSLISSERDQFADVSQHQEYPAGEYHSEYPEEPEESKFGDKLLGFAKKAGMVAGGVIAAPVALAAIGAKTAYDKLKRDSDDEEEQGEPEASDPLLQSVYEKHDSPVQEEQKFISESPVPSEKSSIHQSAGSPILSERSSIQHLPESPVPSESEHPQILETTTTTTITRKHFDEEPIKADSPVEFEKSVIESSSYEEKYDREPSAEDQQLERSASPVPSEKSQSSISARVESPVPSEKSSIQQSAGSPIPSEKSRAESPSHEDKHIIETTTTTTVVREYFDEPEAFAERQSPVPAEKSSVHQSAGSPVPSESEHPHVTETTTTTTVTREIFDEPESPVAEHQFERSASPVLSEKSHSSVAAHPESPIPSEKSRPESPIHEEEPHIIETTTTTTVVREYFEEPEQISDPQSPVPSEKSSIQQSAGSPVPSESEHPQVIETTTTTTVTREYFDEPETTAQRESPVPSEKSNIRESDRSPIPSDDFRSESAHIIESEAPEQFEEEPKYDELTEQQPTEFQRYEDDYSREAQSSPVPSHTETSEDFQHDVLREIPTIEEHLHQHQISSDDQDQSEPIISGVLADGTPIISGSTGGSRENLSKQFEDVHPTESTDFTQHQLSSPEAEKPQDFSSEIHEESERPVGFTQHQEYPEEPEESKFGDKLLGFAKKAGMVAGGVIAAPVALAAIGAKTAYDKLKRDSDDEEDQGESSRFSQHEIESIHEQPSHFDQYQTEIQAEQVPLSPPREQAPILPAEFKRPSPTTSESFLPEKVAHSSEESSEDEIETTAEPSSQYEAEPESPVAEQRSASPVPSEKSQSSISARVESPVPSEKSSIQQSAGSPIPSEKSTEVHEEEPHIVQTTTTTTVVREYFDEPEAFAQRQSPVPSEKSSVDQSAGSPVPSESEHPHVVETTTTTTVTREIFDEQASDRQSPVPSEKSSIQQSAGSPIPSEKSGHDDESHIIETTTTTSVVREYFDESEPLTTDQRESPVPSEKQSADSPIPSESEPYLTETTTTTTVTREAAENSADDEPVPDFIETTTTTVRREVEEQDDDSAHVIETTTTTTFSHQEGSDDFPVTTSTVVREYDEEPEPTEKSTLLRSDEEEEPTESSKLSSSHEEKSEADAPYVIESSEFISQSPIQQRDSISEESHHIPREEDDYEKTSEHDSISEEHPHVIESSEFRQEPSQVPHFERESEEHIIESEEYQSEDVRREEQHQLSSPEAEKPQDFSSEIHEESERPVGFTQHQEYPEEPEESKFGDKLLGFAKKAGMVAGGVIAAPVALAAIGAKTAYDKLKRDSDDEEDQGEPSQYLQDQPSEKFETRIQDSPTSQEYEIIEEPHIIESEDYSHPEHDEERVSSPVLSVDEQPENFAEQPTDIEESHIIESREYDSPHDEEQVSSPTHSEEQNPAERTANQLVSHVFDPLDQHIREYSREHSPQHKKSVEELTSEAFENVQKVSYEQEQEDQEDDWKVYDKHGEVLEEFSTQLTDDVIQEAEGDASQIMADVTPRRQKFLKQESCQEVTNEPEVDYYSDLQEKLNILANEGNLRTLQEEEPSTTTTLSDQLDVIHESEGNEEEDEEEDEAARRAATDLVDDVMRQVLQENDDEQKTVTSDVYQTATEQSKDDQYDTCVTSQEDNYDSAQGWTSQDSEYTSAASGAPSRLSDNADRQETSTPQAVLSPVDSDRHFTVSQDFEMPVIRAFDIDIDTARSTPDVALQVTIEEEDESDDKLPISPSGVLLPPTADPGRPVSPVPPRKNEEQFVFVQQETPPVAESLEKGMTTSIHGISMEASSEDTSDSRYSRQLSDISSESHADTVIQNVDFEQGQTLSGSSDSIDAAGSGSASSVIIRGPGEVSTPEDLSARSEKPVYEEAEDQTAEQLGYEVYQDDQPHSEELETVEEEPEDIDDSLNGTGSGNSPHGSLGKYKHTSSDNLSLTSLQEFERLERELGTRGDGSLTRSEIELLMAGKMSKSGEGSISSLAEFERLEKEVTENISPTEEMMLSLIKEESETEDMSTRDDDEEVDVDVDTEELKSIPVDERVTTPIAPPSPTDSLEQQQQHLTAEQAMYLETSTDSLEPLVEQRRLDDDEKRPDSTAAEYEIVSKVMETSVADSLDGGIPIDKDSVLEGASQGPESQSTHGLLSGDTIGTLAEEDDKDSLDDDMDRMLRSYPTTLTTFQTTSVLPDGSVQTISRRVETRVTDPLVSHVTFTGTESQERLDQLPDDEQFETVDAEGNKKTFFLIIFCRNCFSSSKQKPKNIPDVKKSQLVAPRQISPQDFLPIRNFLIPHKELYFNYL